jgi:hypothetical protein
MFRARLFLKLMTLLAVGGTLMQGACMPDNFWIGKWGEIVNRSIVMGISTVFSNVPGLAAF